MLAPRAPQMEGMRIGKRAEQRVRKFALSTQRIPGPRRCLGPGICSLELIVPLAGELKHHQSINSEGLIRIIPTYRLLMHLFCIQWH